MARDVISCRATHGLPDVLSMRRSKRLDDLDNDPYRLFRCRAIMNCAEVCPKGLEPVHAIERIPLKIAGGSEHAGGLDVHPPIMPT